MSKSSYDTRSLDINLRNFGHNGNVDETAHHIDFKGNYHKKSIDLSESQVRTTKTGNAAVQSFLIPSENPNGELKTVTMGWGGRADHPDALMELSSIRANNPGTDLLVFNNPGKGESSPIPKSVMRQMKKTGSFIPYGELVAKAINDQTSDYDKLSVYGHSEGARTAIGAITHLDKQAKQASLTDAPGSRNLGLFGIADAFLLKESRHAGEYAKRAKEYGLSAPELANEDVMKDMMAMGAVGLKRMFLDEPAVMGKGGLMSDLSKMAASGNVRKVQFNSPEFSELNDPEEIKNILLSLAVTYTDVRFMQAVILGQTHSLNDRNNTQTTGPLSKTLI